MAAEFIPVTVENSVARQRQDAEGEFVRAALGDDLFITSTGYMEVITADGERLESGRYPERALEAFRELPAERRQPGAFEVPDLVEIDADHSPPAPPEDTLVARINGRMLTRDPVDGGVRHARAGDFDGLRDMDADQILRRAHLFETQPDYLWLPADEWRALVREDTAVGDEWSAPAQLVERIARYHLIPGRIWAEGGEWRAADLRGAVLTVRCERIEGDRMHLRLEGSVALGSQYDEELATSPNGPLARGYEARLTGWLVVDRSSQVVERFDLLAVGDSWGRMGDANNRSIEIERPGRWPLAFEFHLVTADAPLIDRGLLPTGRASKVRGFYLADP